MRGCEGRLRGRGRGRGVGVAGGASGNFRRMGLMWFPLAPCIAFAFFRAPMPHRSTDAPDRTKLRQQLSNLPRPSVSPPSQLTAFSTCSAT